ncbi:MAG: magnesium transporter MgtE N-terminal domain-containing protein [Acidimicrobiales bacterium]
MARRPPLPLPSPLRQRREQRTRRLLATRAVRDRVVSLVGVVGGPLFNQAGAEIGTIVDFVAKWDGVESYPPIVGMVVRVGRRKAWVPGSMVADLAQSGARLHSARVDLREYERRDGEVLLARDVLDHQLVDVDGRQVIRAADLYLSKLAPEDLRLVGVDVSPRTLLRRLGPRQLRSRPTPDQVIDWAAIQPFGGSVSTVPLRTTHEGLHRLRPAELADLLEDLGRPARQELLAQLEPETAADAMEEMDAEELETLLRETPPEQAAALIAEMEPDEAAEALRDLGTEEREELLEYMDEDQRETLEDLLEFDEESAGGFMTTFLVTATLEDTVKEVRKRLARAEEHGSDIDAVVVLDSDGRLVDDITLFALAISPGNATMAELTADSPPVTVTPKAEVKEVALRLTDSRRSSVLVCEHEKVLGRILADDIVDALIPGRVRRHFPRLLQ